MKFVPFISDLDAPLLKLEKLSLFTIRHGLMGSAFWGGIGGGKSSSAKVLASAYLRAGFGGLVTAVKPEEVQVWKDYARKNGRGDSLILFDENEGCNVLGYEMARHGMEGIGATTETAMRIVDIARSVSPTASKRGGEPFWDDSSRNALRYTLPPIYSATGSLTIPDIIRFISTAPATVQEPTSQEWQERSFMYKIMNAATKQPKVRMSNAALQNTIDFWRYQWPAIPDKTRGNIVITITAALDRFNHGILNRVFCGKTTVVPELSFGGGVICLGLPTLTLNEDGIIAAQLFKFLWQRAVLSRNSLEEKHRERPLFLWCDEAQDTLNSYDGEFISLCRGAAKCCMTFLSQSLPGYVAKMGGDTPREDAYNLAGKFTTHVFCSNPCPETNEFAAKMLGRVVTRRGTYSNGTSRNVNIGMSAGESENSGWSSNSGWSGNSGAGHPTHGSSGGYGSNSGTGTNWGENRGRSSGTNESRGYSESMEYAIEPGDFARMLKTGGPQNGNIVTAVWFQSGRIFEETGTNWMIARFRQ